MCFDSALPASGVLQHAKSLHLAHGVSFWDAVILAAGLDSGIEILYSEDVAGLDALGSLKVLDPFK